MSRTRKLFSMFLAIGMVLALLVPVHAANQEVTYTGADAGTDTCIEITNAVAGRSYTVYRLFAAQTDETKTPMAVKYTLLPGKSNLQTPAGAISVTVPNPSFDHDKPVSDSNPWVVTRSFTGPIDGSKWFDLAADGTVTAKDTLTEAAMKDAEFKAWALNYGVKLTEYSPAVTNGKIVAEAGGSSSSTANNVLDIKNVPGGYFMVEVEMGSGDTAATPVITVDTTQKLVKIADKNTQPHWNGENGKTIVNKSQTEGMQSESNVDAAGIGEDVNYKLSIITRQTNDKNNGADIYRYYVIDSIASYMSYKLPIVVSMNDTTKITLNENGTLTISDLIAGDPPTQKLGPKGTGMTYIVTYFDIPYTDINWTDSAHANYFTKHQVKPFNKDTVRSFRIDVEVATWAAKNPLPTDPTADKVAVSEHWYTDGSALEIEYTAFIDPDKIPDPNNFDDLKLENKALFAFYDAKDDPTNPQPKQPTEVAPTQTADVYKVNLEIKKVDSDGNPLANQENPDDRAQFTLTGESTIITITEKEVFTLWTAASGVPATEAKYWKLNTHADAYTMDDPDTLIDNHDSTQGHGAAGPHTDACYAFDRTKYASLTDKYYKTVDKSLAGTTTNPNVVATVNTEAIANFTALGDGIFHLTESRVPATYNKAEDLHFAIVFDEATKTFYAAKVVQNASNEWEIVKVDNGAGVLVPEKLMDGTEELFKFTAGATPDQAGKLTVEIVNNQGAEMPQTGGIGTVLFYVLGSLLVLGAVVVLISRRRMNSELN